MNQAVRQNEGNAPVSDVDFYSDQTIADPVSAYHRMLDLGPVVWLEKNNILAICGFSELTESLRNHAVFQSGKGVSINEEINKFVVGSTLNSDPPRHDATRAITFKPLTPKALTAVRERIEHEAEYIVDKLLAQDQFDAAAELAPHLPLTIVRDLVGLGAHGSENMLKWGAATFELMGDPRERRDTALGNLKQMRTFLESPETLNNLPEEGWASRATKGAIEAGFPHDEASELMRDYIPPSLDTTISAIGYGLMLFAQNPDQWDAIRQDPLKIRNAIEEIVRLNTPIRGFTRMVGEDVEVNGVKIAAGTRVLMVFGAANRDAARFPDPDRFDIERNVRGHVGFGHGVHACLGMHLARLEMTCLFECLAKRVKRFELAGPIVPAINASIYSMARVPLQPVLA